jgi:TatD DNase family protein
MLFDTHCHLDTLDLSQYGDSMDTVIENAQKAGVGWMLCVCIDLHRFVNIIDLTKRYKQVMASVGVHPSEVLKVSADWQSVLAAHAALDSVIAIGETGLDYYHDQDTLLCQRQREAFAYHIHIAAQSNKPLIVHTRSAKIDTIDLMRRESADRSGGVMHCFTEDWAMAKQALDLGFYISFSGILTFKNATQIQDVAKKVPLDRFVLETDSPYLAPVPYRGKPNQPAYVAAVAEFMADLRGIPLTEMIRISTQNAQCCFRWPELADIGI